MRLIADQSGTTSTSSDWASSLISSESPAQIAALVSAGGHTGRRNCVVYNPVWLNDHGYISTLPTNLPNKMTDKITIGTILHGALGDVYEQALCFKILRDSKYAGRKLIAFFSRDDRLKAFQHYKLDMFDEIRPWQDIESVHTDLFDQFQVKDEELQQDIFSQLSPKQASKFSNLPNVLPWVKLREYATGTKPLKLELSTEGISHYKRLLSIYQLSEENLAQNGVGYLWRYRAPGDAVKPVFQAKKERLLKTKSELMNQLVSEYGMHIVIAGMKGGKAISQDLNDIREKSGVVAGEVRAKFAQESLAVPSERVTFLSGLGYAAEMEIIANTKFQILMPSGFSEPIWMRNGSRCLLADTPPIYMLKILKYRMPLFDSRSLGGLLYNCRRYHSAKTVIKELKRRRLIG